MSVRRRPLDVVDNIDVARITNRLESQAEPFLEHRKDGRSRTAATSVRYAVAFLPHTEMIAALEMANRTVARMASTSEAARFCVFVVA